MNVVINGYPFFRNGNGGVARYTLEVARALGAEPGVSLGVEIPKRSKFPPPIPHFHEGGVAAFFARRRADICHSFWYRFPNKPARARLVTTVYDWIDADVPLYRPNVAGFVNKQLRAIAASDGIVAISEDVARRTAGKTGVPADRIAVAPPFPAAAFGQAPDRKPAIAFRERTTGGAPYILHLGARGLYKNFTTVLRAFLAASGRTDRHLVIVGGEPSLPDDDVFRIARAGCMERVHFLRRLDDETLRLAYRAADAYASASHMEGFGLPVVEALACGTLPVLSDIPVYREVAGPYARYAPVVDVDAWADLFAAELAPVAGGREATLARYSAKASAGAIVALYEHIL